MFFQLKYELLNLAQIFSELTLQIIPLTKLVSLILFLCITLVQIFYQLACMLPPLEQMFLNKPVRLFIFQKHSQLTSQLLTIIVHHFLPLLYIFFNPTRFFLLHIFSN